MTDHYSDMSVKDLIDERTLAELRITREQKLIMKINQLIARKREIISGEALKIPEQEIIEK